MWDKKISTQRSAHYLLTYYLTVLQFDTNGPWLSLDYLVLQSYSFECKVKRSQHNEL